MEAEVAPIWFFKIVRLAVLSPFVFMRLLPASCWLHALLPPPMMQRILLLVLFCPTVVIGASFDCKKATTRVENLICVNSDLSWLDDTLSETFALEVTRGEDAAQLRTAQKAWLAARNACTEVTCIQRHYERRIAQLSCDHQSAMAGSARGASQCAYFSLRELDRELLLIEGRYSRRVSQDSNNPDFAIRTFKEEQTAWRSYRAAYCAHYGSIEGGSDGWKNAFAGICEVDETKKRMMRLNNEIGEK